VSFRGGDEGGNIFAECRRTLRNGQPANPDELVENAGASKKCAVANGNITTEKTVIGDDHVIADCTIVSDVGTNHQEIVASKSRHGSFSRAPVNGTVLADHVAVADFDSTFPFRLERKILRSRADDGTVTNEIIHANNNVSFQNRVGLDDR